MEKDFSYLFPHQLSHHQSSYFNSSSSLLNLGLQNNIRPCASPSGNVASPNGTLPGFAFSGIPYPKLSQPNVTQGWSSGPPCQHQAFNVAPNFMPHLKMPHVPQLNHEEIVTGTANLGLIPAQKRFIVFDQSGDQTKLFISPGTGPPVQLISEAPKLNIDYNMNKVAEIETFRRQEPILTCAYDGKQIDDSQSEMHEDTEELNALLYSDDEYYEDDEASTGHSPSTMTGSDEQAWAGESEEEVGSNLRPSKRMKLFDGASEVSPLMDTATSGKQRDCCDCEDDAELSSNGDGKSQNLVEFGLSGGKKRSRKDQIRETVDLLKSIIPGGKGKGKGKDVIMIFDEAIDYLNTLRHKAQVLGVRTI